MPNAKKEFTLHDSFGYWIIRLCRAMQSNLTRQLAAFDLNSRLLAILMSVEEVDMRTPSAIADHLLVDR
ncbi:MAG: hypothetical protein KDJ29_15720, partial [Hyphomicrobiales bacterium]|nr:hypothetical protein [Hyphomicrobiales bacterium]